MINPGAIYERFCKSVRLYPERPFLHAPAETAEIYKLQRTDYTYEEAAAAIDRLATAYGRLGAGPGVRVGLAFENRPEFFLHFLALNGLGASILPLNPAMAADELRYQIDHSEAQLVVAVSALAASIKAAGGGAPLTTPDALAECGVALNSETDVDVAAREAALLYTSGTTGTPKGCVLSNEYFCEVGDLYTGLGGYCTFTSGAERIATPLPVTHMNALAVSFMAATQTGGCLIQLDRFHPKSWWRTIRESRATIIHYLGVMPAMLLNMPEAPEDDFSDQLKFAFGAGCDPRHHARFESRFGVKLIEAWAMTETGGGAWITASEEPRHVGSRCFGKALPGLEWRLVDEEGNDVAPGEAGELLVRRAGERPRRFFFTEYLKDPAATDAAWADGWFHTGDVVRVDDDGSFYFVDRRKNVIRRSGENIAAIEVESVLMRHAGVASCVVVPVPDEIRGEEVAALVIAKETGDEKLADELFALAQDALVYFKAPAFIAFVDSIPMTASEKIKRAEAKEMARSKVERGEVHDFTARKKGRKAS